MFGLIQTLSHLPRSWPDGSEHTPHHSYFDGHSCDASSICRWLRKGGGSHSNNETQQKSAVGHEPGRKKGHWLNSCKMVLCCHMPNEKGTNCGDWSGKDQQRLGCTKKKVVCGLLPKERVPFQWTEKCCRDWGFWQMCTLYRVFQIRLSLGPRESSQDLWERREVHLHRWIYRSSTTWGHRR